jgi:hypothetical protein
MGAERATGSKRIRHCLADDVIGAVHVGIDQGAIMRPKQPAVDSCACIAQMFGDSFPIEETTFRRVAFETLNAER